jgi:hypothetical protein
VSASPVASQGLVGGAGMTREAAARWIARLIAERPKIHL